MTEGADVSFVHLGITIEHLRNSISIGGFEIAFYGIIIGIGMLAGLYMAQKDARRRGQDPELYLDFALYAIIFSIIGARLYYVIFDWELYKDNPIEIFNLRGGGRAAQRPVARQSWLAQTVHRTVWLVRNSLGPRVAFNLKECCRSDGSAACAGGEGVNLREPFYSSLLSDEAVAGLRVFTVAYGELTGSGRLCRAVSLVVLAFILRAL